MLDRRVEEVPGGVDAAPMVGVPGRRSGQPDDQDRVESPGQVASELAGDLLDDLETGTGRSVQRRRPGQGRPLRDDDEHLEPVDDVERDATPPAGPSRRPPTSRSASMAEPRVGGRRRSASPPGSGPGRRTTPIAPSGSSTTRPRRPASHGDVLARRRRRRSNRPTRNERPVPDPASRRACRCESRTSSTPSSAEQRDGLSSELRPPSAAPTGRRRTR